MFFCFKLTHRPKKIILAWGKIMFVMWLWEVGITNLVLILKSQLNLETVVKTFDKVAT